ncbi:HD domain-containing protein [Halovenus salina]|uniref:HD domain-containing protein n=1 Tax=Halovenus salina TaxID=1510225 RepID=A0ABD5VY25_9EURY|nr:HD domain-containing protein [Halovenus salina]
MDELPAVARSYFDDEMNPAHDWHHVERVENLAETLLDEYDVDETVVRHAVLLHDIGRAHEDAGEIDDHAEWGAREAETVLADRSFDDDHIEAVCHCIRVHRYSNALEPETREAEILCDADNLDALGAVGIARCFSYGGERGETIYDPEIPPDTDDTTAGAHQYNHFYKKILDLPERMYTDAGRAIADDRAAFVESFLDRFDREIAGDA